MAVVHIPALILDLTDGEDCIEVEIAPDARMTVRELLAEVERRHPGVESRLLDNGELVPGIAVFIDGEQSRAGLHANAGPESEIHFIPAVVGG